MFEIFKMLGLYEPSEEELCAGLQKDYEEAKASKLMKDHKLVMTGAGTYKIIVVRQGCEELNMDYRYQRWGRKSEAMEKYISIYRHELYLIADREHFEVK